MNYKALFSIALTCLLLTSCGGATRLDANKLPKGYTLNKKLSIPSDVPLAIYLPKSVLEGSFVQKYSNRRVEVGKSLISAMDTVTNKYFTKVSYFDPSSDENFGLLLDIEPKWDYKNGDIVLTFNYKVLNAQQKIIMESSTTYEGTFNYQYPNVGFYNSSLRATQQMMVKLLNKLKPTAAIYPEVATMNSVSTELLADMEKPVSSGTGFHINANGQILTAAHVIRNCLVVKAQVGEKVTNASLVQESPLLDLAVMETGKPTENYLKFRKTNDIVLGEKVTTVSYPLKGLLEASPNLTLGNISSKKALKGSLGLFQFSAPIQPGSSGGPIVSEHGDVLGVVTSTLNISSLVERGVIPQNVNFGLDTKYINKFLNKHSFEYKYNSKKLDSKNVSDATLAATVQLACYQ